VLRNSNQRNSATNVDTKIFDALKEYGSLDFYGNVTDESKKTKFGVRRPAIGNQRKKRNVAGSIKA